MNPLRLEHQRWAPAVLLFALLLPARAAGPGLHQSKHNLALSGGIKSLSVADADMCKFCHTPHGGLPDQPLWNHAFSAATYIPYSSTTLKATVGQPTGDSKLCLSCHDGTVALGMLHRQKQNASARLTSLRMAPGRAVLGTDLSDDHPVSFTYDATLAAGAQLRDPALLNNRVRLDLRGQVQCTSCHDPHNDQNGMFLVQNNYGSALCLSCHDPKLWNVSAHRTSGRTWNGMGKNPWPHTTQTTVAGNGCENCHAPHHAGTRQRLLNFAQPEENCLFCHNGSVALKNVASDLNKPSVHPVLATASLHDEAEDPVNYQKRHSSCVDCHNPHAANGNRAVPPNASGALAGVTGVNATGVLIKSVTRQYELCFRCHAESTARGAAAVLRQWPQTSLRLQFKPANASYHPVVAAGKNGRVPSLLVPWNIASYVYCTDCHNSDQGPGAGGVGPNGPHGSLYAPILERNLVQQDFQAESPAAYALCYKCHSRASILSDASFQWHRKHVVDLQTACSTCHDPHGVATNPRLINFNTLYVKPAAGKGAIKYNASGIKEQACTLSCHGADHPVVKK
jgi:predicted CXXCH cytochrome family protein